MSTALRSSFTVFEVTDLIYQSIYLILCVCVCGAVGADGPTGDWFWTFRTEPVLPPCVSLKKPIYKTQISKPAALCSFLNKHWTRVVLLGLCGTVTRFFSAGECLHVNGSVGSIGVGGCLSLTHTHLFLFKVVQMRLRLSLCSRI